MILLSMIFCHIIDDYYLQGWLASAKQKQYWKNLSNYSDKYKYDYVVALFMHSLSWSFMIMLPLSIIYKFNVPTIFFVAYFINVFIHAFVDNAKANWMKINLIQDQLIHIVQIILTWLFLIVV